MTVSVVDILTASKEPGLGLGFICLNLFFAQQHCLLNYQRLALKLEQGRQPLIQIDFQ